MNNRFNKSMFARLADNEVSQFKSNSFTLASRLWNLAKVKVANRYGYSIEIKDEYRISIINEYLKELDKNFIKRNVSDNGLLSNTSVLLPIDENTFLYVIAGNPLLSNENSLLFAYENENTLISNKLRIFIYGKHAKKYINIIKNKITKKSTNGLKIFNISSNKNDSDRESFQSIISDMKPRDIDTLFYDTDVKESVIRHIDGFFNSKQLYEEKNINYKTSILLYGPPGTGKSSLANALCDKYDIDMVLINMTTFDRLDINILTQCINGDDKTYLILIEDIDTIFNLDRESGETIEKDDKKVINKLLQFMDSNSSPNNVIFICTTNHIDKLDEALLRKGRIDKNVYIGPINKEKARIMCESFDISDESIDSILSKYSDDDLINQSSLQSDILDVIKAETIKKAGEINVEKALSDAKEETTNE